MTEQFISEVQRRMLPYLNNAQLLQLKTALTAALQGATVCYEEDAPAPSGQKATEAFLSAKRIEGCSEKTLGYYHKTIEAMLSGIGKTAQQITTEDLRKYLTDYQVQRKSSKVTIDNIRRILSSFFSWLEDENFIVKSPVRRIHKVKTAKVVKDTYTDEALELMRDHCTAVRDLAIIDLLASSGMRVGELVTLNQEDINFNERECVVLGKGNKERLVYFDARTKIHLQNYLASRTDSNPALFVSLKAPYERLMIGGVETRLRELGQRLNIPKVHPHKFRRTLATSAIDKGMPIEQLQRLLGHQRIDTTLQYAMVKQSNVKIAHRKYVELRGVFFKDVRFKSENEYRFLFSIADKRIPHSEKDAQKYTGLYNKRLCEDFCVKQGLIVPFMKVSIPKNAIRRITMAPMTETEIAKSSIKELLNTMGFKNANGQDIPIFKSKIPIRF